MRHQAAATRLVLPFSFGDLLSCLLVLWFGSYACVYVGDQYGVKPLYSYFVLMGYAALRFLRVAAVGQLPLAARSHATQAYLFWLAAYLVYGCWSYLRSSQSEVAFQTFCTLLDAVALGVSFTFVLTSSTRIHQVQTQVAVLACLSTIVNVIDFLHPTFSNVPGRAAGLYENPNISAFYVSLLMVAGTAGVPRGLRGPYLCFCGVGVFLTFSRMGWLMWAISVIGLSWEGLVGNRRFRPLIFAFAAIVGLGFLYFILVGDFGSLLAGSDVGQHLDRNTLGRLGLSGGSVMSGDASDERRGVALYALDQFYAHPFLGNGLGHVYEWEYSVGPHNMFLLFMAEGGVVGLALYLWLLVALWRSAQNAGRVMVMLLLAGSLFSHNLTEQPAALLVFAFVFAHGAIARRHVRGTHQQLPMGQLA